MTPSELKRAVEAAGQERYFFTRDSMKFFGDTMSNYGCRAVTLEETYTGNNVDCWELYRKRATSKGQTRSAYFNRASFKQEFTK